LTLNFAAATARYLGTLFRIAATIDPAANGFWAPQTATSMTTFEIAAIECEQLLEGSATAV
jgi:hypothetical protein